jgi:hypothetical protein
VEFPSLADDNVRRGFFEPWQLQAWTPAIRRWPLDALQGYRAKLTDEDTDTQASG